MEIKNGRIFTNENCTGCNRCISACTVPEANVAILEEGKNKIHVDGDRCINCAMCIKACPHDARDFEDDTTVFLEKLKQGKEISILVAPAVRSNFTDYKKLLGLFRKLGVKNIYDTSFGADICTWAYLTYITSKNVRGLISQPCPAIVNYIEKHDPELLPMLAPIHSPAMCCAIYMKKYKKIPGEYAFISPCISKKDEFSDPNTGNIVQYNVTFQKLVEELKKRGINYMESAPSEFDNEKHDLGCLYPMPGGLKTNVLEKVPDAWVHQVEGQPEVKHFLDEYSKTSKDNHPLLVDILNCPHGCNMGTGAICTDEHGLVVDKAMYEAQQDVCGSKEYKKKLSRAQQKKIEVSSGLKLDDFIRHYNNKKINEIPVDAPMLEKAYGELYKMTEQERRIDCCSCGYETCKDMATAIAKGINHPGNCVEYHKSVLKNRQEEVSALLDQQNQMSQELADNVGQIFDAISQSSQRTEETAEQVSQINNELSGVKEIALKLSEMVDALRRQIDDYVKMGGQIVDISLQTKLLSTNASIEAAHAKDQGRGFAIVADEMKRLADQSADSAKEISQSNETVLPILDEVLSFSHNLNVRTQTISENTEGILEAVKAISQTEQEIAETAARIKENANKSM